MLQARAQRTIAGDSLQALHLHRQLIQVRLARELELVVGRETRELQDQLLDLTREHIHTPDDQHVIGAPGDSRHPAHRARRRRQERGQIASAVADHRQGFLGERSEHQLARRALG